MKILTHDDECPKGPDGKHIPDISTVTLTVDGGEAYVDVNCVYCGRSGCFGKFDTLTESIDW